MATPKRLIVGLGNPGPEYEGTRHNIGFEVVDALAVHARGTFSHEAGNTLLAWGSVRGYRFGMAKPLTYMNRSGAAVRALLRRHGLVPAELLVISDDINLAPGVLRLRPGGSAGGHNGLQDIIDVLGTDAFPRLRFGVGNNFPRGRQADYVLEPFPAEERPEIDAAVVRARDAAVAFVTEGLTAAMNRFNG